MNITKHSGESLPSPSGLKPSQQNSIPQDKQDVEETVAMKVVMKVVMKRDTKHSVGRLKMTSHPLVYVTPTMQWRFQT